jgi:endosialidase-like protein
MTKKSVLFGGRRAYGTSPGVDCPALPTSAGGANLNLNKPLIPLIIPLVRNSSGCWPSRRGFLLIPIAMALACFALSPVARAVSPPPDGGYPRSNTAEGTDALKSLSTGAFNTALGFDALFANTTGSSNTATGLSALQNNKTGNGNTADGLDALFANTTGSSNTATGLGALQNNTTANGNTADGLDALFANTTGSNNTATGLGALQNNTTGNGNAADGFNALYHNITGGFNTAYGIAALNSNTTGASNIALSVGAGQNLTTGNNNIDIGNPGVAGESNKIRVGTAGTQTATFIAGIRGSAVPSGVGVIVGTNGQLGTVISSERFKEAIKPMGKASEAILALKPVTFRYRHKLDPEGIPQFGLVAEQVEKVNSDLVARDRQGKVVTVRYEAVNAMLLNEFLKEYRKVHELEAAIAQQRTEIKALAASLKEQTLQIQTVSATLKGANSHRKPQLVTDNR